MKPKERPSSQQEPNLRDHSLTLTAVVVVAAVAAAVVVEVVAAVVVAAVVGTLKEDYYATVHSFWGSIQQVKRAIVGMLAQCQEDPSSAFCEAIGSLVHGWAHRES